MTGRLFDLPDPEPDAKPGPQVNANMSADQRRTARQRWYAEQGINPYTRTRGPEGHTCGDCAHAVCVVWHRRNYYKCGLDRGRWTHGPGTDLRLWWPACHRWEPEGDAPRASEFHG